MKRRILVILAFAMVALMLFACAPVDDNSNQTDPTGDPQPGATSSGPTDAADEVEYRETLTVVTGLKFITTDTMNTTSAVTLGVYNLVYNNLVEYDTLTKEFMPALAESWEEVSPTEWVFYLRKDVKFHNGDDFSAKDVVFTFDRAKEEGASKSKVVTIDHVEEIDDYTVKFVLKGPDADLLYRFPDGRLSILSKAAFDSMSADEANMIGTGPFMYEEVVIDLIVKLTRNDNYWGGLSKTKNIHFKDIPEPASRLIALQTGEVDLIQSPASTDLHYVEQSSELALHRHPSGILRYFGFNTKESPFDDIRVRQAVAYGINRQEYMDVTYDGVALEVTTMMNPINDFFAEIDGYEYNPDKAKELLAEANYSDGSLKIQVTGKQEFRDEKFATVFQSQMKKIGIDVEVNLVEPATFASSVMPGSGVFWQSEINAWGGYVNGADNALRYLYYTDNAGNASRISDPKLDQLLDDGAMVSDVSKRMEIYTEIQQYGLDQAVYIPICVEVSHFASVAALEGFKPPHGSIPQLRDIAVPVK